MIVALVALVILAAMVAAYVLGMSRTEPPDWRSCLLVLAIPVDFVLLVASMHAWAGS